VPEGDGVTGAGAAVPAQWPPEGAGAVLELLSNGEVELKGRIPWSSNATFLVSVRAIDGQEVLAIYKPARGERALWDFPRGLWRREVAAYRLACHLGWDMVPPTVARVDGPLGLGSLQLCVDASPDDHYFTLLDGGEHDLELRRVAVFDLLANNADRKAGHCLLDRAGRIWAIDNGLCFHAEPKLRTVIWDFAGEQINEDLLEPLGPLSLGEVQRALGELLDAEEAEALVTRASALRRKPKFPAPRTEYYYPWPLI